MNHQVGKFGGKRVFKPKDIASPTGGGADCSRYFGAQALLMQKPTLPEVVEHMETHKVLPMDWIQGALPRALAWRPQIARSPIQKFNKLPEFCSKKVHKSTISGSPLSFKRESTKKIAAPRNPTIDINLWMDSFRSETQ